MDPRCVCSGLDPLTVMYYTLAWTHLVSWSGPTWGTGLNLLGVLVGTHALGVLGLDPPGVLV